MKLKTAFYCAVTEFIKWITDTRMIINAVLLVFIYTFAQEPLLSNAALMNEPLNVFEPFIAVANSGVILLILPLTFMTLIADFPNIDTSTVLYIYRTGRINWLLGQVIKLIMMALSFITVIFLGSVIPMIPNGFLADSWSNVATRFSIMFPERSESFGVRLLPENLYNQLSVYDAAFKSYVLIFAYIIIIGLILLFFSLIKMKTCGFFVCGGMILLGTALCSIKSSLMWIMPMANSIIWLHYTKYYRAPVVPIWFSVFYLCSIIIILIFGCFAAIRKFNYDNMSEVGF